MANGNGDNQLGPGESNRSNYLIGSPFTAKEAVGNLAWRYAKDLPSEVWNLIKAPGQVYSGELQPTMTPGPNQLSVPEYAMGLAGMGLGVGVGGAAVGAELAPEGAITHFPAFHGTPAAPYSQFEDRFMGTGEGAQSYSWGHYVAGNQGTAQSYVPPSRAELTFDGKPWDYSGDPDDYHRDMAQEHLMDANGDIGHAVMNLHQDADLLQEHIDDPHTLTTGAQRDKVDDLRSTAQYLLDNQDKIGVSHMPPGNLANVWVTPDHEEFMDWDLPFSKQEPGVQQKLTDMFNKKMQDPNTGFMKNYLTGRDPPGRVIYDDLVGEHYDKLWQQPGFSLNVNRTAAMNASKELDANGIPGMRFADQQSRAMTPDRLQYNGSEPIHPVVQQLMPHYGDIDRLQSYLSYNASPLAGHQFQDAIDFVNRNRSNFSTIRNPNMTYNYVVYDPKNINITHWNGVPVEPVEGNPFAASEGPHLGDEFGLQ